MDWETAVEMSLAPREQEESNKSALKVVLNFKLSITEYPLEPTFDIHSGLFAPQSINNLETLILSLVKNGAVQGKWRYCIPFLGKSSRNSTCYSVMKQARAFFVPTFSKSKWKVLTSLKYSVWYTSWLPLC